MTVGNLCQRSVDTADALESVQTAAQRMGTRNVGTLVVLQSHGRPAGILTDRDVAVRVAARGRDAYTTSVGDVMTRAPETVLESLPVEEALRRMRTRGVRRLPVVDAEGACVGLISLDDILMHLIREFARMERLIEASAPGLGP